MSRISEKKLLVAENKLKKQLQGLVKSLHVEFHGPKMKVYAAKLKKEKADKIKAEKIKKENQKKEKK